MTRTERFVRAVVWCSLGAVLAAVFGGLGLGLYYAVQQDRACEARGGVVVRGYCFKKDALSEAPK